VCDAEGVAWRMTDASADSQAGRPQGDKGQRIVAVTVADNRCGALGALQWGTV